ncbi:8-oxoguanine DNA glycosylase [Clostridium polyendosporum]|uniref:DNA-(apurinic or apyrimidinic site) lyase n=1 Tax=Clostridium polyendosporum TaxID=69208 RepID=A0A919RY91_9CLOT|nr:DNA-3-methyladenine glycosylase 2 family protein [Clostridium polyendosporum]GIM28479.1 8-oxoguanine DNA glycosylase [Clostridium polyendosporum]
MDFEKVEYDNNKVILRNTRNFNIKQTFECGQCFRWEREKNGNYIGVAHNRVIELEQNGDDVIIHNTNEEDFNNLWIDYFDLKRNYSKIKEELSEDELLKKSVEFGYGIRILKQQPFEILVSFIISARNSIPIISKTIKKISERWGTSIEYKGRTYFSFPTVEQLHRADLEDIKGTGASFRSKYIYDTIQKVYKCNELLNDIEKDPTKFIFTEENKPDILKYDLNMITDMNDDQCHLALQEFQGVGAKVADCIMLFSMRKYSAFPVDVWIKRAMQHFYLAPDVSLNKIRIFARDKFGELAGFAQQYLFYYARENNIKV